MKLETLDPFFQIDKDGNSHIMKLIEENMEDDAVSFYQEYPHVTTLQNYYGETPFIYCIKKQRNNLAKIMSSIDGFDLVDKKGRNGLIIAILFDNEEICDFLIEKNMFIFEKDEFGFSPICYAFFLRKMKTIHQLALRSYRKIDAFCCHMFPSEIGDLKDFPLAFTLSHIAVHYYDLNLLFYALFTSANMNIKDSNGLTAIEYAFHKGYVKHINYLSEYGGDAPLFRIIFSNDIDIFKQQYSLYKDCFGIRGSSPLHYAVRYSRKEMIEILFADSHNKCDFYGRSSVYYASPIDVPYLCELEEKYLDHSTKISDYDRFCNAFIANIKAYSIAAINEFNKLQLKIRNMIVIIALNLF